MDLECPVRPSHESRRRAVPVLASRILGTAGASLLVVLLASAIDAQDDTTSAPPAPAVPVLFDGKSLEGWRIIEKFDFDGHGDVYVKDGVIYLEKGKPATGIAWKGEFPKSNYELSLQGQRVEGSDFFCGLTFPVKDSFCTLILGGWGGSVVGLSNIDGFSAIENETTQAIDFQQGRWYQIKLTVLDDRITVAIDGKPLIDVATEGHKFSIWWEQEPVTPLGIVSWYTTGALKDLKLTSVPLAPPQP
jgi:hypothetical protein